MRRDYLAPADTQVDRSSQQRVKDDGHSRTVAVTDYELNRTTRAQVNHTCCVHCMQLEAAG